MDSILDKHPADKASSQTQRGTTRDAHAAAHLTRPLLLLRLSVAAAAAVVAAGWWAIAWPRAVAAAAAVTSVTCLRRVSAVLRLAIGRLAVWLRRWLLARIAATAVATTLGPILAKQLAKQAAGAGVVAVIRGQLLRVRAGAGWDRGAGVRRCGAGRVATGARILLGLQLAGQSSVLVLLGSIVRPIEGVAAALGVGRRGALAGRVGRGAVRTVVDEGPGGFGGLLPLRLFCDGVDVEPVCGASV